MASRDGEEGLGIVVAHDAMAHSVRTCKGNGRRIILLGFLTVLYYGHTSFSWGNQI